MAPTGDKKDNGKRTVLVQGDLNGNPFIKMQPFFMLLMPPLIFLVCIVSAIRIVTCLGNLRNWSKCSFIFKDADNDKFRITLWKDGEENTVTQMYVTNLKPFVNSNLVNSNRASQ